MPITASTLYNWVACPHRVSMDAFADPAGRDPESPFVELLWERGNAYEKEVIAGLGVPFLDLSRYPPAERERRTLEAIARGEPLIHAGRIAAGDLLGVPDLLRREGRGYVPGDIKSGRGKAGEGEGAGLKRHYAVQLALYVDVLERRGLSAGRRGFVWDVHGEEVTYDLTAARGRRSPGSWWDDYRGCLAEARAALERSVETLPAYSAECKLCHWYTQCRRELERRDDLTLLPELGRAKRDALATRLATRRDLAAADPEDYVEGGRSVFRRIGARTLRRLHARAVLAVDPQAGPYLTAPVALPEAGRELFFDIEVDPMRDVCYLHGFLERSGRDDATERYVAFLAETPTAEAERRAFAEALAYWQAAQPCATYYYSKYERTIWRKLQQKYPQVCEPGDIEALFDPARAVDLYHDVVRRHSEWPTVDLSIKTLAKRLGFAWRDTHPSGAASIEWYDRWVRSGDPGVRQRILDYNEDDCRATRVLVDGIRALPVRGVA